MFVYQRAKSILSTNVEALITNWYKQKFTVLYWRTVSYLNLIGQISYVCQNINQITALTESGQNLVTKTYFWPFCSKQAIDREQKTKYGK